MAPGPGREAAPVSPFHDLGGRGGGPLTAECACDFPSAGHTPAAARRPGEPSDVPGLSLTRFAQLLALGVLGLAVLLSLGVGGVALVQDQSPRHQVREGN
jgi:hypothetical protein